VDGAEFDAWTRRLEAARSRRGVSRAFLGAGVALILVGRTPRPAMAICGMDAECGPREACCNDNCVDLTRRESCGACGRQCGPREACCDGNCVDLSRRESCGGCDRRCDSGYDCVNGDCVQTRAECERQCEARRRAPSGQVLFSVPCRIVCYDKIGAP
jgi:hypothetical protein